MASEAAYIRAFKAFARGDLQIIDLMQHEQEAYGQNSRATVVMLGAVVEGCLERLVRSNLRPSLNSDDDRLLFDFVGPLGSFGSKTIVAYGFNLFGPETRSDLDLIRLLRNEFAHSRRAMQFTDKEVAAVCGRLKSPDWPGSFIPHGYLETADLDIAADLTHPKTRFISACHSVSERLLDHSNVVGATRTKDLR